MRCSLGFTRLLSSLRLSEFRKLTSCLHVGAFLRCTRCTAILFHVYTGAVSVNMLPVSRLLKELCLYVSISESISEHLFEFLFLHRSRFHSCAVASVRVWIFLVGFWFFNHSLWHLSGELNCGRMIFEKVKDGKDHHLSLLSTKKPSKLIKIMTDFTETWFSWTLSINSGLKVWPFKSI